MDPYYEQRLRDEVIYLHSLWRRGPPRKNPNHNPSASSRGHPAQHLQPSNPTQFKKNVDIPRKKRGKRGGKNKNRLPPADPGPEWQCEKPPENPPPTSSGWPALKLDSGPETRLPSHEEQAWLAATKSQQKAVQAAREFFAAENGGSDGEEAGGGDDDDLMEECGQEEYKFFLNTFMENRELRNYYENNCEGGEFLCLVCGGIGKMVTKRFKNCVALVQHSITIAKTKKKRAHRTYAQAICKVLAWDINHLPSIALSLAKSAESEGNADDGNKGLGSEINNTGQLKSNEVANIRQEEGSHISSVLDSSGAVNNEMVCEVSVDDDDKKGLGSEINNNIELIPNEVEEVRQEEELHVSSAPGFLGIANNDVIVCEGSLIAVHANECIENLEGVALNVADGNKGVLNSLENHIQDGVENNGNCTKVNVISVACDALKESNENQY